MTREVFVAGQILTAAEMNVVSDQTVMSFAGTAARGSAIPSPVEGMTTYLEDSDILSIYDGSAWKTSLGVTGGILQVVSTTKTDTFSTSSTTYTDITGLSATITPRSTSSKIFVMATVTGSGTAANTQIHLQLVRDSTAIFIGDAAGSRTRATVTGTEGLSAEVYSMAASGLDSPSTTSSVTYKVQAKTQGQSTVYINRSQGDTDTAVRPRTVSTITLIEVAG